MSKTIVCDHDTIDEHISEKHFKKLLRCVSQCERGAYILAVFRDHKGRWKEYEFVPGGMDVDPWYSENAGPVVEEGPQPIHVYQLRDVLRRKDRNRIARVLLRGSANYLPTIYVRNTNRRRVGVFKHCWIHGLKFSGVN